MGLGGVGLGGLLVGLGLKAAKPWVVLGSWIMVLVAPGTSAGWAELCLGGLRLGSELLARLGLRPVADT